MILETIVMLCAVAPQVVNVNNSTFQKDFTVKGERPNFECQKSLIKCVHRKVREARKAKELIVDFRLNEEIALEKCILEQK